MLLTLIASALAQPPAVPNRDPLEPSRLIELPPGAIRPEGWLRHQLQLQADGFHGHLGEISPWLNPQNNAWLDAQGRGEQGWEEVPYWLKGYLNCALALDDADMLEDARVWIEGALNSQQPDGWFGPDAGRTGLATDLTGRDDLWPNMIMLFCLMDFYEHAPDPRILDLMTRYFRYLEAVPEDRFLVGYWPNLRAGDQLRAIHWLYNRTGEPWLLDLARKTHRHTARWDQGVIDWHNVNIAQGFREPAQWWVQSHEEADLLGADRNWREVRARYGQVPGGMFGADENARPGFDDPRQAIETCGIVEEMLSDEILAGITGDMVWADRCEDAAYNALPAAFTADMKALRYLSAPNQPVSDAQNHAPGIQNGGAMFLMSPHRHRCCQHNAGHGWPYLARHLWYATPDGGLAAIFYSESTLDATLRPGQRIRIAQRTDYPFGDTVTLTISTDRPTAFPLALRIPGWCDGASIEINGDTQKADAFPRSLARLEREWSDGDTVVLRLPMRIRIREWPGNHGSRSIDRGPLTYSLDIGERYRRVSDAGAQVPGLSAPQRAALDERWPAWEILPEGDWNYGLDLAAGDIRIARQRPLQPDTSPWTPASSPIVLEAPARLIPQWQLDAHGLAAPLQDSPAATNQPVETVRLIPMGAARIRISAFPIASAEPGAHEWTAPQRPRRLYDASASHTYGGDTVDAIADGIEPSASDDHSIARHTFWPHLGGTEWLEASFSAPREVSSVSVYWFDDRTIGGGCRVPGAWRLLYREGDAWKPVATADPPTTERDRYNTITFTPVSTSALRLEVDLRDGFSAGVLEWKVR
ncbi:MAG: glycoside hydrolase family 127 protein [Phycisphaeraceae bacterium]|nr:glycoside hydrolase family 127 protein [Phycisphaeraceae bacterium]